jgi:hypothetical protein
MLLLDVNYQPGGHIYKHNLTYIFQLYTEMSPIKSSVFLNILTNDIFITEHDAIT